MKTSISRRLFLTIFIIVIGISALILLANSLLLKPLYYSSIRNAMLRGMDTLSMVDYTNEWRTLADEIKELTAGNSYGVTVLSDDGGVLYSDSREFGLMPRGEGADGETGDTGNGSEADAAESDENNGRNSRGPGSELWWSGDVRDMVSVLSQNMANDWEQVDENTTIGIITEPRTEIAMYICLRKTGSGVTIILTQAVEPINQSIWQANFLLIACAVITLGLSAIVVFKLSRRFTEPIRKIKYKVGEIASLNFGEPCLIKTGDELESLGSDVNLLAAKLKNALDTLRLQNEQLEKDIVAQRQFISNASHELRTPLSLIKGYADEMAAGYAAEASQKELYISVIAEEAAKMNRLLREMLELSRMQSGRVAMQNEVFCVREKIQAFLDKYDGYISENRLDIRVTGDDEARGVFDPMCFEQVLANYISNAARYGHAEKCIEISIKDRGDSVRIAVFNTGNPIGEQTMPYIWNGFYKANSARTRDSDSYGLGLSIVKAIQTTAGQQYGARNAPGGVEFWFDVRSAEFHARKE